MRAAHCQANYVSTCPAAAAGAALTMRRSPLAGLLRRPQLGTATSVAAWKGATAAGMGARFGATLGAGRTDGTLAGFCTAGSTAWPAGGAMASRSARQMVPCVGSSVFQ